MNATKSKTTKEDKHVRVLCCVCHEFFDTPRMCLECSNWNVCLPCLKKESDEIDKRLAARGIVLPK